MPSLRSAAAILLVLVLFGLAAYYLASWTRRTLRVLPDGVVIGHVFSEREVPWSCVRRFTIREPSRRTPISSRFIGGPTRRS